MADRLIKHSTDRIPVEFSTVNKSGEPVKWFRFPQARGRGRGGGDEHRVAGQTVRHPPAGNRGVLPDQRHEPADRTVADQAADRLQGGRQRQLLRPDGSKGRAVDAAVFVQPAGRHQLRPDGQQTGPGDGRRADRPVGGARRSARHRSDFDNDQERRGPGRDRQAVDGGGPAGVRRNAVGVLLRHVRDVGRRGRSGGAAAVGLRPLAEREISGQGRVRDAAAERNGVDQQHRRLLQRQPPGDDRRLPAEHFACTRIRMRTRRRTRSG